jgi:LacI family transcriptional regulator
MTAKIRQVAAKAKVSSATVSRVLNGSRSVAPAYRDRDLSAIKELDYHPNGLARHFRLQTADVVGILVSDIENPHFTSMVRAPEDATYRHGKRALLCNTDENPEKERAYLEVMARDRVLGVLISTSDPASPGIPRLLDLGIPVIAFDRLVRDPRVDAVIADNWTAGRVATELLLQVGHRQVGCISGPQTVQTAADRLAGYELVMRSAGLESKSASGLFRVDGACAATHELLDTAPELTAIVVTNNLMAMGALKALNERHVAIPDRVALVAIDDPFWSNLVRPRLTTLAQPIRPMAERVVQLLFERLANRDREPRIEKFPVELRLRDSCGTLSHRELKRAPMVRRTRSTTILRHRDRSCDEAMADPWLVLEANPGTDIGARGGCE